MNGRAGRGKAPPALSCSCIILSPRSFVGLLCLAFYNLAAQEVKMRDSADLKKFLLQMCL